MKRLFLDPNTLAFAFGRDHPLRAPCRELVVAAERSQLELHVSTEAIQEFLHHRMRVAARTQAVLQTRTVVDLCRIHAFDAAVLRRAIDLVGDGSARGRNAVHAATAMLHGFSGIVTDDDEFDGIPGLARLDPRDV